MAEFSSIQYSYFCDNCRDGATVNRFGEMNGIKAVNIAAGRKACGFHKTKNGILCDRCFREIRRHV